MKSYFSERITLTIVVPKLCLVVDSCVHKIHHKASKPPKLMAGKMWYSAKCGNYSGHFRTFYRAAQNVLLRAAWYVSAAIVEQIV